MKPKYSRLLKKKKMFLPATKAHLWNVFQGEWVQKTKHSVFLQCPLLPLPPPSLVWEEKTISREKNRFQVTQFEPLDPAILNTALDFPFEYANAFPFWLKITWYVFLIFAHEGALVSAWKMDGEVLGKLCFAMWYLRRCIEDVLNKSMPA